MGLQLHKVVLRDIFNFSFYIILDFSSLFVESLSFIGFKNYNSLLIFTLHLQSSSLLSVQADSSTQDPLKNS